MIRVGIIGSRGRDTSDDYKLTENAFIKLCSYNLTQNIPKNITIVSGGCPKGGDRFAEIIAKKYGCETLIFPADWNKYGKRAGFIRNNDIAQNSDYLIACLSEGSKGTQDTINKFLKTKDKTKLILV